MIAMAREAVHVVVKREREAANLKIPDCAEAMGVGPNTWRRIENGRRTITADEVPAIADILGVSVLRLYGLQPMALPVQRKPRKQRQLTAMKAGGQK